MSEIKHFKIIKINFVRRQNLPLIFISIQFEPSYEVLAEVPGQSHVNIPATALWVGCSSKHAQLAFVECTS